MASDSYDHPETPGTYPESVPAESQASINTRQSLAQAIHTRRAEYTRSHQTRVKIGTWNVAATGGVEKDVGGWFIGGKAVAEALAGLDISTVGPSSTSSMGGDPTPLVTPHSQHAERETVEHQEARTSKRAPTIPEGDHGTLAGGSDIGIYALGLQEVVDITSAAEALRPFSDVTTAQRWKRAMEESLPPGYVLVAEQQLTGLLLLIYASPTIAPSVGSVSTTSVGTGLMGYMGNKGGVSARLVLGETTTLVFVNCHLAAGADKPALDRRDWDAGQITTRTRFAPIEGTEGPKSASESADSGLGIGSEDLGWWFGDLNYRIDGLPGDDVRRLLTRHTEALDDDARVAPQEEHASNGDSHSSSNRNSTASSGDSTGEASFKSAASSIGSATRDAVLKPRDDPASLQTTLSSLLPHDQLRQQQRAGKAFHDGWREGEINFLPTYKYDIGSVGRFDSGEKKRGPSWCDRILFRTRHDRAAVLRKNKEAEDARKRDDEMKKQGIDKAASEEEDVLFDYDPETDGADLEDSLPPRSAEMPHDGDMAVDPGRPDDPIHLEVYASHQRVLSSDHKPLTAIFTLKYDAVVPQLKAQVHDEVARALDKAENEERPGVTIVIDRSPEDPSSADADTPASAPSPSTRAAGNAGVADDGIDFGEICYYQQKRRGVTIANTSRVPARISFVGGPSPIGTTPKPSTASMPKSPGPGPESRLKALGVPWLDVEFDGQPTNTDPNPNSPTTELMLEPGDAINAVLDLQVTDIELARSLNDGQTKLETVLVLRVINGRDHFLPVRASWLQSCFGRSVEELVREPEGGIRELPKSSAYDLTAEERRWSAPREILRLTEAIESLVDRVVAEWSMTHPPTPDPSLSKHSGDENHPFGTPLDKPPWENYVSWPFKPASWSLTSLAHRLHLQALVHSALDRSMNPTSLFPPATPPIEQLEIIAQVLVTFLASLTDGIIPAPLWGDKMEPALTQRESTHPQHPYGGDNDEEATMEARAFILDMLEPWPSHHISFVFLTTMLAHVAGAVAPLRHPDGDLAPPAATETTSSRHGRGHRKSGSHSSHGGRGLSHDPVVARRQVVDEGFAKIFARVMIRGGTEVEGKGLKEKERKKVEARRRGVVEVFLRGGWEKTSERGR